MSKFILPLLFLLALSISGCASLEPQVKVLEKQYIDFREKYKDGVVMYNETDSKFINFVSINMNDSGEVEMLAKRKSWSFVYDLGFRYENRSMSSECRVAKIEYRVHFRSLLDFITLKEKGQ
jgi:hypothetical protein